MTGREVSVLSFVDGNTIKTMTSAQDHKRAKDGDQGTEYRRNGNVFSKSVLYKRGGCFLQGAYLSGSTVDAMKAEGRHLRELFSLD